MAKLYWRVKDVKTNKWKWIAVTRFNTEVQLGNCKPYNLEYSNLEEE